MNSDAAADLKGMLNINSKLRIADVPDGTSNTFAIGEKFVDRTSTANISTTDGPAYRWGFHAVRNTVSPMNAWPLTPWGNLDATFGSQHTGGSNFVFVDGAVRFIPQSIGLTMFQRLSNRADGRSVELP